MLFIIFGWKTRTKEYGPTYPTECPHCTNDNYFHLLKARRWFSLFFIPLIPLSSASYNLVCPTCNASITLDKPAASQAKALADSTARYQNDEQTVNEYEHDLNAFETDIFGQRGGPTDVDKVNYADGTSASGSILRGLAALLFAVAILGTISGIEARNPNTVFTLLFMIPYLAIRYRDPNSTTVPFAGYVQRHA